MRVAHVIVGLEVGGAETMLLKLLGDFAGSGSGITSTVISLMPAGPLAVPMRELEVPVHCLGMASALDIPRTVWRLRQLAHTLDSDAVQGWMYHGNVAATLLAGWSPRRPELYWNIRHSLSDPSREKALTRLVIRLGARWSARPRAVIHNAGVSIDQHAAVGYRRANAIMIPNGFDLARFRPDPGVRAEMRRTWGLPTEATVVGHLGRLHPMKGHELFLAALGEVLAGRPAVHVVMAGRGVEPAEGRLAAAVAAAGLGDRVHLLGQTREPERFLAALDIFCLPSLYGEGFPNVVGEAMACGVPCLVTDVGEAARIVDSTAQVVAAGDRSALVAGLGALLDRGGDELARLGAAARRRIAENYGLEAIAARYGDLYRTRGAGVSK